MQGCSVNIIDDVAGRLFRRKGALIESAAAEIDLDAIAFNFRTVKKLVGPTVKVCPAVKADAYGHGILEVGRILVREGADMLGVANFSEASLLRKNGIVSPILVMHCSPPYLFPEIVRYEVTSTLCDLDSAVELSRCAEDVGKKAKVHLKVDTGMGRLGVQSEKAAEFALEVSELSGLEVEGIFTHFPCADEDDEGFTNRQIEEFEIIVDEIEKAGMNIPIKHAANSAAVIRFPNSYFDMVRPGIMIYGLSDFEHELQLRPGMTLKSRIMFLKELPAGRPVSYGRTYITSGSTRIATIPIGYGDGYNRLLSNRASVLVRGRRALVVGRVCMDQTLLDVSAVENVSVGDEVVLYGRQGDEEVTVSEIASLLGTISYEVVCAVGKRVPRFYKGGNNDIC